MEKRMKKFVLLLFATYIGFILVGCASTNSRPVATVITQSRTVKKLDNKKVVLLNLPKDGTYERKVYKGTGEIYQEKLLHYLSQRAENIVLSSKVGATVYENKLIAKEKGATYLFYSTIEHWEDRATNWSGKSDRIKVYFQVYDIVEDKLVYSANLAANNTYYFENERYDNTPAEKLLDQVLPKLMTELYE
jgi:hypothetical protein